MKNSTYNKIFDTFVVSIGKAISFMVLLGVISLAYWGLFSLVEWQLGFILPTSWWAWLSLTIPTSVVYFFITALSVSSNQYNRQGFRYFWMILGTKLAIKRDPSNNNVIIECTEITDWLDENADSLFEQYTSDKDYIYFVFLRKSDAMACKLRWDAED